MSAFGQYPSVARGLRIRKLSVAGKMSLAVAIPISLLQSAQAYRFCREP